MSVDLGKTGRKGTGGGGQETSFTGKQDQGAQPNTMLNVTRVCVCVCVCVKEIDYHPMREKGQH